MIDDHFHGNGELYLLDGIEIKGNWNKGFLKSGTIFINQIDEITCLKIETIKGKKNYNLVLKNKTINIKDKFEKSWKVEDKSYKLAV